MIGIVFIHVASAIGRDESSTCEQACEGPYRAMQPVLMQNAGSGSFVTLYSACVRETEL